jgi:dTDP-4-amino-4,6-dideoxygalactose transaminase
MTDDAASGRAATTKVPARTRPDTERVMRPGSAQVGEAEGKAVEEVLNDQVFYRYHGSKVTAFEQRFAAGLLDGRRTLAVNSGSSALQIAFAALDTEPGFEVLVPVLGFVSAATAVIAAGGMPRFVPVDRSLGIDVPAAASYVTNRTRAVLTVHYAGATCDLTAVSGFARAHGLHVVEDAAQACGASFAGRPAGTHGVVSAFSFQHFKLLSTGEGAWSPVRTPTSWTAPSASTTPPATGWHAMPPSESGGCGCLQVTCGCPSWRARSA